MKKEYSMKKWHKISKKSFFLKILKGMGLDLLDFIIVTPQLYVLYKPMTFAYFVSVHDTYDYFLFVEVIAD